jgi:hypothetical protein
VMEVVLCVRMRMRDVFHDIKPGTSVEACN